MLLDPLFANRIERPQAIAITDDTGQYTFEQLLGMVFVFCAGEKVAPREIEEVLSRHPAILESAAVGRPDATRGEAVVAFVVLQPNASATAEELRSFCREQGLVSFKLPREFIFVPELPRSPTGKVLKRVLAEGAAQATP